MEKDLVNIVVEISRAKKTGILIVSVKNDNALFKLFFRAGTIYHIRYGKLWDSACLPGLPQLDLNTGFFLPGAKVEVQNADLPSPEELLAQIKKAGRKITWEAAPEAGQSLIENAVLVKLEEGLFSIAGPIASMVLQNAYSSCNLKKGAPISSEEFEQLVQAIKKLLPDEQKQAFVESYGG